MTRIYIIDMSDNRTRKEKIIDFLKYAHNFLYLVALIILSIKYGVLGFCGVLMLFIIEAVILDKLGFLDPKF